MSYSILVKVNNTKYNNQKFFLYKSAEDSLTVFTLEEAKAIEAILQSCYAFSEIEIVPRDKEEIKLLEDFWGVNGSDLDFSFEEIQVDCKGILEKLEELDFRVSGIDYEETKRQIFENK